jgi:hypothetical protein
MAGLRIWCVGIAWLVAAAELLPAQYPGQYPGQYPPTSPMPPMPRLPSPRRGKKKPGEQKPSPKEVLPEYSGRIEKLSADSITVVAADTRILSFKCTKITQYLQDEKEIERTVLKPGDEIIIAARKDEDGFFYAVKVMLEKAAAAASPAPPAAKEKAGGEAPAEEEAPAQKEAPVIKPATVSTDPDDEGPPTLRRGKPAPRSPKPILMPEPEQAVVVATNRDAVNVPEPSRDPQNDEFIEKARETAMTFSESLPNYLCQQMTTRYQGEGRPIDWQALDLVTASVVYEDGKESYHNIKIGNKAVNKPMEELPGSWSRGEFGTTLRDLFSPSTNGLFRRRAESTMSGRTAVVYDFLVEQPNSHWQTIIGGQSVFPAYKGSVWIDKRTFRVLRIEMQARNVPEEFPLDTIEWVVDYAFVRIGTTEFLVPVHAENLSCWRGSSRCARNALDFRNYRKFTSESQIMTTDSTVSFEGAEPPKSEPAGRSPKKK